MSHQDETQDNKESIEEPTIETIEIDSIKDDIEPSDVHTLEDTDHFHDSGENGEPEETSTNSEENEDLDQSTQLIKDDNEEKLKPNKWSIIKRSIIVTLTIFFIISTVLFTIQEVYKTVRLEGITEKLGGANLTVEDIREQQRTIEEIRQQQNTNVIGSLSGGLGLAPSNYFNDTERINVLLMGLDTRQDDLTGRADTLMVFSFNQATGVVDMVSIPRDLYVEIVGEGYKDKINHSFAFGGKEMTIDTVEKLLDIDMDYHVVFNFQGFMDIVDALGGIEVTVPFDFTEQDSKGNQHAIKLEEGYQTLNGEQALAYARMRKQDPKGDAGRGERQQEVIKATVDELKQLQSIGTYISIFTSLATSMDTNITVGDLPMLTPKIQNVKSFNAVSLTGEGTYIDGIYYALPNEQKLEEVKLLLQTEGLSELETEVTRNQVK